MCGLRITKGPVAIGLLVDARVDDDTIEGAGVGCRVRSNLSGLGTFGAYSGILNRAGFPRVQNRQESPSHSFRAPAHGTDDFDRDAKSRSGSSGT